MGAIVWRFVQSDDEPVSSPAANAGYDITLQDHTLGSKGAKVVLIEYAAPVCPHCAYFNQAYFPALKARYIDTGKVLYVFRIYPVRPGDGPAARLAACLPESQFLPFMDLLFRNQPDWDADEYPGANLHDGLLRLTRIAHLAPERAEQCMADTAQDTAINNIAADAEAHYGVHSTPTFVINGVPHENVPFDQVPKLLDQALAAE
jgi:protein-disulfide isomerase